MIDFAERIIRIKCTTDKGLLDSFKTQIVDSRTKDPESSILVQMFKTWHKF